MRTGTTRAPWILIEADDKRHARIRVLEEACDALERALDGRVGPVADAPEELVLDATGASEFDTDQS